MNAINSINSILAAFEPLPEWLDFVILAAAILIVAFAVFLWMVFFPRKERHHHKRRVRRRRLEHRRVNPTLAESGGLPPIRDEKKSGAP
ncbi:MAG: hypothetical protein ACREFE_16665 [Limisphaerales bacterium]